LLSSDPETVEMNGWTNPVIARQAPLSHKAWAADQSAVVRRVSETHGTVWDNMGYDASSNENLIFLRGLTSR